MDDCECNVDTVDFFNNVKIFPRLQSLLVKDFFRFYKVTRPSSVQWCAPRPRVFACLEPG